MINKNIHEFMQQGIGTAKNNMKEYKKISQIMKKYINRSLKKEDLVWWICHFFSLNSQLSTKSIRLLS